MRPLSLIRPSAWPAWGGPAAADSGSAGAGRGGAHRVSEAAGARPRLRSRAGHHGTEVSSRRGEPVVAELGGRPVDAASRTGRAANNGAALAGHIDLAFEQSADADLVQSVET